MNFRIGRKVPPMTAPDTPTPPDDEALLCKAAEALRLTAEYASLPPTPGWSWWDAYVALTHRLGLPGMRDIVEAQQRDAYDRAGDVARVRNTAVDLVDALIAAYDTGNSAAMSEAEEALCVHAQAEVERARAEAARRLAEASGPPADLAEAAWGLIANAYDGNWDTAPPDWRQAAVRWRDAWHATLDTTDDSRPADGPVPARTSEGYSTGPWVAVRVFPEGEHWAIDLVDADNGCSEAVWDNYDGVRLDLSSAVLHATTFAATYGDGSELPIRVWDLLAPDPIG